MLIRLRIHALRNKRTGTLVTYFGHDFGGSFHVNLHTTTLQPLDDHTHPAQCRDELESTDDTKLEEVRTLVKVSAYVTATAMV